MKLILKVLGLSLPTRLVMNTQKFQPWLMIGDVTVQVLMAIFGNKFWLPTAGRCHLPAYCEGFVGQITVQQSSDRTGIGRLCVQPVLSVGRHSLRL